MVRDTETAYGSLVVLVITVYGGQKTERRGHSPAKLRVILMVGRDMQTVYGSLVLMVITAYIIRNKFSKTILKQT